MQKSKHNFSHQRMTTYPMGYLVPTLCRLHCPGDEIDLEAMDIVRLDPFTFPVMDNVELISDYYLVPISDIWEGFERMLTDLVVDQPSFVSEQFVETLSKSAPWFPYAWLPRDVTNPSAPGINSARMNLFQCLWQGGTVNYTGSSDNFIPNVTGTNFSLGLATHLGCPIPSCRNLETGVFSRPTKELTIDNSNNDGALRLSALPILAYNKIIDDYYRDEEMEQPSLDWPLDPIKHGESSIFGLASSLSDPAVTSTPALCTKGVRANMLNPAYWTQIRRWRADDGSVPLNSVRDNGFALRRCNWDADILTTRRPDPQRGDASSVTVGSDGLITVDELLEATAIQNLRLRQQRTGGKLDEFYKKTFGIESRSAADGWTRHVGREVMGLEISDVYQTSATEQGSTPQGNPVGYSRTVGTYKKRRIRADSFCFLMRISRVMPRPTYMFTIDPIFNYMTQYDFFNPKLESIGWQPIPASMVCCYQPEVDPAHTTGMDARYLSAPSGWQPPFETYRRQLSYAMSMFNPMYGDNVTSRETFARDYTLADNTATNPYESFVINPNFRKADPTNAPFQVIDDSPTQVKHFVQYDYECDSIVPYAINNNCLTH